MPTACQPSMTSSSTTMARMTVTVGSQTASAAVRDSPARRRPAIHTPYGTAVPARPPSATNSQPRASGTPLPDRIAIGTSTADTSPNIADATAAQLPPRRADATTMMNTVLPAVAVSASRAATGSSGRANPEVTARMLPTTPTAAAATISGRSRSRPSAAIAQRHEHREQVHQRRDARHVLALHGGEVADVRDEGRGRGGARRRPRGTGVRTRAGRRPGARTTIASASPAST